MLTWSILVYILMNVTQKQDAILTSYRVSFFFSLKKKELTMNVGGCLLKEIIQLTDKRTEKLRQ